MPAGAAEPDPRVAELLPMCVECNVAHAAILDILASSQGIGLSNAIGRALATIHEAHAPARAQPAEQGGEVVRLIAEGTRLVPGMSSVVYTMHDAAEGLLRTAWLDPIILTTRLPPRREAPTVEAKAERPGESK